MLVLLIVARWGGLRWDTAICRRKWSDLSTFPTVNRHQRVIQFVKFLTLPLLLLRIDPSTNTVSSIRLNLRATQTSLWDRSNEVKINWLPDNYANKKNCARIYFWILTFDKLLLHFCWDSDEDWGRWTRDLYCIRFWWFLLGGWWW